MDRNVAALFSVSHLLTDENLATLRKFDASRRGNLSSRIGNILTKRVYRQTVLGDLGLVGAAILRRM